MTKRKPKVKLIGADGNVFNVIGLCRQALRKVDVNLEKEFTDKAMASKSYSDVLILAMDYCDVH